MPIHDYNELKPHAKHCGYYVYLDEHPTIELNQSSRLGIPAIIFIFLGLAQLSSESYFTFGAINLLIGISFGISYLMFKENRKRLKIKIRKFKITKLGIVITRFKEQPIFIGKDEVEGLEIVDFDNPFAHKQLVLKNKEQVEDIILMKSMDAKDQTENALITIANYIADLWNVE